MTIRLPYLDDPVLRLIPSEPPESFLALPPEEQAWRGRFFLVTWLLYGSEPYAWAAALADDPEGESKRAIAGVPDGMIAADMALISAVLAEEPPGGPQ